MPNGLLTVFLSLVLILINPCTLATSHTEFPYQVFVIKSKRLLVVKKGSRIIKKYHVALGQGGAGGKRIEGDKRTPEGEYEVVDFRPSRKFHYFIHLNYPNYQDAITGYEEGLISWEELVHIYRAHQEQNGIPPQRTRLGGFIGIHGLGKETPQKLVIHQDVNWTQGCIALTNAEIDELRQFIHRGTQVTILNEPIGTGLFTDIDVVSSIPLAD
jgi:murein L,D-transpeptidase YafK